LGKKAAKGGQGEKQKNGGTKRDTSEKHGRESYISVSGRWKNGIICARGKSSKRSYLGEKTIAKG